MKFATDSLVSLLQAFAQETGSQNTLLLHLSDLRLFVLRDFPDKTEVFTEDKVNKIPKDYDLIIGDLPFGEKTTKDVNGIKFKRNYAILVGAVEKISEKGFGFFVVEPSFIYSDKGKELIKYLEETKGIFLSAVLQVPEKLFSRFAAIQPLVVAFSRLNTEKLFIAEINFSNSKQIAVNLTQNNQGKDLFEGLLVDKDSFKSFDGFKAEHQIDILRTQYKEYSRYRLSDIAVKIELANNVNESAPNSFYFSAKGKFQIFLKATNVSSKSGFYYRVTLNPEVVFADYLVLFYKSALGKLIIESLSKSSTIPSISKEDFASSWVAVPPLDEQAVLIEADSKLTELQKTIDELKDELSLNPQNSAMILNKFDEIQKPFELMSSEEEILNLIRQGESDILEFKETFSKCIKNNQNNEEVKKSSIKTIIGFLNSEEGGTLLIGVSDKGELKGIENDFYKDNDKYQLNFTNALFSKIGYEFNKFIKYRIYDVRNKKVLKVHCMPSDKPCFFESKEFYIRLNPLTKKLEGKEFLEYTQSRFKLS